MTETGTVALSGVWKRYSRRGRWILREVDLQITAATVHVLLGGNGDGKSTLLRIAAGASRPSRGRIGRPRPSTAYVPEHLPADLRLSATEYLAHMARLRGRDQAAVRARSTAVLERLELRPGPDVLIRELSRGNRQKVSLAQAFGAQARVTVLDEPFAGLDQEAAGHLRALLAENRAAGRSVLISAHPDREEVPADRRYTLADGRLRALPPSEATDRPVTRLVLRTVGETPLGLDQPDVLSVEPGPAAGEVVVLTTEPDDVLRATLGQGWSFVQGGPGASR